MGQKKNLLKLLFQYQRDRDRNNKRNKSLVSSKFSISFSLVLLVLLILFTLNTSFTEANISSISIYGHGFGHGVGMCQWGAKGMADSGKSYAEILRYYYANTWVGSYTGNRIIRVLLSNDRLQLTFSADAPFRVIDTGSGSVIGSAGTGEVWRAVLSQGWIEIYNGSGVLLRKTTNPVKVESTNGRVRWSDAGKNYRGNFYIHALAPGFLYLTNELDLEDYVKGIGEMPSSWHMEALKAQAVAARVYAYLSWYYPRYPGVFNIYSTVADQVYVGLEKETGYMGRRWVEACDKTNRQLIFDSAGNAIKAYYHSTCGGHTENSEDVWRSPLSYARAVPCGYCAASPHKNWGPLTFTIENLRSLLGEPNLASLYVKTRGERRVKTVALKRTDGSEVTTSGAAIRTRLGLKSTWFYIGPPRIFGFTRYETALALSSQNFTNAANVVIATGENFPDALAGAPLAHALSAPILLVPRGVLPDNVKNEIYRLGAIKAVVLGGESAISSTTASALESLGLQVERIGGADRYETSYLIYQKLKALSGSVPTKIAVATGENFPDALAFSGVGARMSIPIILVNKNAIPAPVQPAISEVPNKIILGGEAAVSTMVASLLQNPPRLAGSDRYSTARAIAEFAIAAGNGFTLSSIFICTGENFPDALSAGVVSAMKGSPLLLTAKNHFSPPAKEFIQVNRTNIEKVTIIGGEQAISREAENQIAATL